MRPTQRGHRDRGQARAFEHATLGTSLTMLRAEINELESMYEAVLHAWLEPAGLLRARAAR